MLDLSSVPLIDDHSHAGLYERRRGRIETVADLISPDQSSTYRGLLRAACSDLYGSEANWSEAVTRQFDDGIEPAYSRMLERLGIRAVMWDFRRIGRDAWPSERYRLIYWIDQFICPFPDPSFWRGDDMQAALCEALAEAGLHSLPEDFADYLAFVETTLRRERPHTFGLKLLLGYQRSLGFASVALSDVSRTYTQLRSGNQQDYRLFQDSMARWLFRLAGELDLPLQIHASFGGPSSRIQLRNNDPGLLEPLLADPENRATRVVLLHGGYPFTSHAAALVWQYAGAYLDFSVLPTLFTAPLRRWLEEWIELLPSNKILFGTDASAPEEYYTAATNGRRQLAAALDSLRENGVVTRSEAVHLAERISHQNAVDLYRLDDLRL